MSQNLELQIQAKNRPQTFVGGHNLLSKYDREQAGLHPDMWRRMAFDRLWSLELSFTRLLLRENTGIPAPATLMSGLKQKRWGDCWLERGCAGALTARLPTWQAPAENGLVGGFET